MTDFAKEFIARSRAFLSSDYLPKIERCLEALTDEDVWWRAGEESNSIGNLLLHLEGSTRMWVVDVAGGSKSPRDRQQEFDERRHVPKAELVGRIRRMLAEADGVLARLDPGALLELRKSPWEEVTVFFAVYHAVEHFAMHTGQIIMLAKMRAGADLLRLAMPSFEHVILETERLLLRPLRASDAAPLYAVFSDARVMRYWNSVPWSDMAQANDLLARDRVAMAAGHYLRLAIEPREDGHLVGFCTFFDLVDESRRAEIGYALAHAAWGKGYMHEALVALLEYGFTDLRLNRVEADIDPRNEASRRSLERLGFKKEGFLPERWIVAGEVTDTDLYGLLARDWKQRGSLVAESRGS